MQPWNESLGKCKWGELISSLLLRVPLIPSFFVVRVEALDERICGLWAVRSIWVWLWFDPLLFDLLQQWSENTPCLTQLICNTE